MTTRMNPEVKALWVADLRANPDKQGRGVLSATDGKDCCLGRLCRLAVTAGIIPTSTESTDFDRCFIYGEDKATLPESVMHWAGLIVPQGAVVEIYGRKALLSTHNDNPLGVTFLQIADAIEDQL